MDPFKLNGGEKGWDQSVMERRSWIEPDEEILPMRICAVTRSMADARHLFYGSQRMVIFLKRKRYEVNRKRRCQHPEPASRHLPAGLSGSGQPSVRHHPIEGTSAHAPSIKRRTPFISALKLVDLLLSRSSIGPITLEPETF